MKFIYVIPALIAILWFGVGIMFPEYRWQAYLCGLGFAVAAGVAASQGERND